MCVLTIDNICHQSTAVVSICAALILCYQ